MREYVDFDTHVYEPITVFRDYMDPKFRDRAPQLFKGDDGRLMLQMAEHVYPKVPGHPGFYNIYGEESTVDRSGNDPHARLKRMDAENTDVHVIFPTLGMMGFANAVGDPELALAQARAYNRYMGEFCSVDRRRLRGAMLIPSNHPEIAAAELRRAHKEEGLSILYLNPTPPNDVPWCDASREPIFRAAEELDITVVFHESTPGAAAHTMGIHRYRGRWPLIYLATHVVEAMFAYADVILGGVLERHPKLRVGSAEAHIHWLPGWLAMMDQQFSVASNIHGKKGGEEALSLKPSEYFIRQCFCAAFPQDTMIPEAMGVAPDSIVVISDWPHPLAGQYSQKGLAAIEHNPRIDPASRHKLLVDNPRRFL